MLLIGNRWGFCKVSWSWVHLWLFLFRSRRLWLQTVPCGQCAGCASLHTLALQFPGIPLFLDAITALSVFLIISLVLTGFSLVQYPISFVCLFFFNSFSIITPGGRHVLLHRIHPLPYGTLHLVDSPSLCPSGSLSLGHSFGSLTAQSTELPFQVSLLLSEGMNCRKVSPPISTAYSWASTWSIA